MMKQFLPARPATSEECKRLAKYLAWEQGDFVLTVTSKHYQEIKQAVNEATITVFPNHYRDGSHQVWVIWSDNYPQLPNHAEHFKISKDGTKVARIFMLTRRKYHRAN